MTDEQIKQNAIKAAADFKDWHHPQMSFYDGYIAGAHSRDEEINKLQEENLHMESLLSMHRKMTGEYELKLQKLCDPWISVEDRLPEESKKYKGWLSDTVFVVTNKDDGTSARYDHATKTWCPAKILQGSITHWMPIQN
jgi:hypothetical protein